MKAPLWTLVRLLATAAPGGALALCVLVLARALLPIGYLLSMGALVSAVAGAESDGGGRLDASHPAAGIIAPLVLLGVLVVAQELVDAAQELQASALGRRISRATSAAILDGALRAGVTALETPGVADRISLAQGQGPGSLPPGAAVPALAQLVTARLAGIAAAVTLAQYAWWAPLPIAAAWVFTGRWLDREVRGAVRGFASDTSRLRRASYLRELGLSPSGAKELRVFGLGDWLVGRFSTVWLEGMREVLAHRQRSSALAARVGLLTVTHLAVLGGLAFAASRGLLDIGQLTVAVQAALGLAALGYVGDAQWTLRNAVTALPHVLAVRDLAAADPMPRGHTAATGLPAREIRFDAVGFGYPGTDRRVLDGLELAIPAGRSLALVGVNGVGKTTLLKLLARLHEPDSGRVSVDGTDLRDLDPDCWRSQIAAVFQDFCRFEMTLRDNIRFGAVRSPGSDADVIEALRLAGGDDLLDLLPGGLDTLLSRQYDGGAELSGGQWQKVALARALYGVRCGARVLILDEPTAHLDVRAESRLYQRFLELTEGITTILVSHRFSTVRLADRICVLRDGRVVESGSHAELVDERGEYARMYGVQAARFRAEAIRG